MPALILALLFTLDGPAPPCASTVRAVWLADVQLHNARPGQGRFVFVPGSATDEVDGRVLVEAEGPPGVLRTVFFARGETDEGLDEWEG